METYLFYRMCKKEDYTGNVESNINKLPVNYSFVLWKPSLRNIVPKGLQLFPFAVWWIFHHTRIFRNRDYSLALIYDGDTLIHRSGIFPPYFRFPFMSQNDLQIGDTWTHPDYRGQGLATYTVLRIIDEYLTSHRCLWYLVSSNNKASIRVIEKSGFQMVAYGKRKKRFGLSILGAYTIDNKESNHE